MEPAAVGEVLSDPGHTLGTLCRHARLLARLDSLLAEFTGPDTATRFQVANVRQDRLILVTPTASWATRLRLQAPQFLTFLQGSGYPGLRHIDIHVAPLNRPEPPSRPRRALSPAAEQALAQLRRLARR